MSGKFFRTICGFIFILFIFSFLGITLLGQDNKPDENEKLREEIISAYKAGGKPALIDFFKKNQDKITNKFIIDFAELGKKERKRDWLQACEIMAKEKKDDKTIAEVLYKLGTFFRITLNHNEAIDYFEKALPLFSELKDYVGQGKVYLGKGDVYNTIGENQKTNDMLGKALYFFKKGNSIIGQGHVYLRMGDINFRTKGGSLTLIMYKKALDFFNKAKDSWGQGYVYLKMGNIYYYNGDKEKANQLFEKSLFFFKKIQNFWGLGDVYIMMAKSYPDTVDKSLKFDMLNKALDCFEKVDNLMGKGEAYFNIGRIYVGICKYYKAIEMFEKALIYFEKAESPIGQGNIYVEKGDIYFYTGNTKIAFDMYNKALHFFNKAEMVLGQGNVYQAIGWNYFYLGDYSRALKSYSKAMPLLQTAGDLHGQGNIYICSGEIYFKMGKYSKALKMYKKSLKLYKKNGSDLGIGNVYQDKGDILFMKGKYFRAIKMYNKAAHFYKKVGAPDLESYTFHKKAKMLVKLGKQDDALNLFEKAITFLGKVRSQTAFSEMKKTFLVKVYEQYQETVLFMLENGYLEKGFRYSESMRSRVFLDRMAEGLVRLEKGMKTELKEQRDNMVGKLSALSKQMQETAAKDEKKLKELKVEYRKVESEFEDLLIKIRLDNPLYAQVRYPQPITVQELQKDVLKEGEVLVRYFISPEKLYVFLVSKEGFKVVPLKVKEKVVNGIVNLYSQALKENNYRRIIRYGNKLYRELFQPLEGYLKGSREIIIIPDGDLATIPFESLVVDRNRGGKPVYLIEKYRLKYIQSASILTVLRKHYQRDGNRNNFIGFGDPVYDYENFTKGLPEQGSDIRSPKRGDEIWELHHDRYARQGGVLNRLRGSGESVKAIAGLFEKHNQKSVINLREQATEENAKGAGMKNFDFIHFACHGLLNEDFQSLVLSQLPPDKSQEDGYFTLNEIMNCDYNARLVVLSACQTGSGKMERGEGVTGLTRAVMYAGTPAVVASLWDVDDTATKELMVSFYRNMLEKNLEKVEALRQAKLELLKNKKYASPLYWGAFVLYGE